jgi:4-amino-4-deoxy-L-arabinose transferase-like glycosyltransferase
MLWAIAALAFLVRLGAGLWTGGLWHPELWEYDQIARSLLAGRGFSLPHLMITYYSYVTPLHSWATAAGYWLTGSTVALMLLQMAAGAALAVVVACISRRIFGGWMAGAIAGTLVAIHPGFVLYNSTKAHSLAFDSLFFALALLQSFRLAERPTLRRFLIFGLIIGVGTLSRGTMLIMGPLGGFWLLARSPRESRAILFRHLALAGLLAAVIIAPWAIRNSLMHHRLVLLISTESEDFWLGNNPRATGHTLIDAEHTVFMSLPPDERDDLYRQPHEMAQADWFSQRSRAFVKAHPGEFFRLWALKFFNFWWYAPQTGAKYPGSWFYLYMIFYAVMLVLAAVGVLRIIQLGPPATQMGWLVGIFLVGLSLLQSVYHVDGRHRWGIEPILLALSGGGAAFLLERLLRKKSRTATIS